MLDLLFGALTSLGGLAVPGLGAVSAIGSILVPQAKRVLKWSLIGAGLAAVAIYIMVIKLDSARKDTTIARKDGEITKAEARATEAEGLQKRWQMAAEERDRAIALRDVQLQEVVALNAGNLEELKRLRQHYDATVEQLGRQADQARAQGLAQCQLKERMHVEAKREQAQCPQAGPNGVYGPGAGKRAFHRWLQLNPDPAARAGSAGGAAAGRP